MSRRRWKHGSYRSIRTTQERRSSFAYEKKYVRPARNFANLPNSYDDKHVHGDTSWKGARKTQYRANGRGKQHEMVINTTDFNRWRWAAQYTLRDYFVKHDIPYRIDEIKEQYTYKSYPSKSVLRFVRPRYQLKYSWVTGADGERSIQRVQGHQIGWETIYDFVPTGEIKIVKASKTVGYRITWWSDKDIGIDYILSSVHC